MYKITIKVLIIKFRFEILILEVKLHTKFKNIHIVSEIKKVNNNFSDRNDDAEKNN